MKLVTWNMDSWKSKWRDTSHDHGAAWDFLQTELDADVALLQECVPPAGARGVWRPEGIGPTRSWGSAVVVRSAAYEPLTHAEGIWRGRKLGTAPLLRTSPGTVAIARVDLGSISVTAVSIYGLIEHGYASGTLMRVLADLEPLLDDPRYSDHVVIAGDLNIGTQWCGADLRYRDRDANTLDRFAALGLVDLVDLLLPAERGRLDGCRCSLGDSCRHVRTHRHNRWPEIPYQVDYFFANPALAERAVSAEPLDSSRIWDLSDHCPIVVEIEI